MENEKRIRNNSPPIQFVSNVEIQLNNLLAYLTATCSRSRFLCLSRAYHYIEREKHTDSGLRKIKIQKQHTKKNSERERGAPEMRCERWRIIIRRKCAMQSENAAANRAKMKTHSERSRKCVLYESSRAKTQRRRRRRHSNIKATAPTIKGEQANRENTSLNIFVILLIISTSRYLPSFA